MAELIARHIMQITVIIIELLITINYNTYVTLRLTNIGRLRLINKVEIIYTII